MESSNAPAEERKNKCCYCNAQICSSYVLGMFACVLVVGGVYLAFHKWDYMWLVVSAVGIVLTLIGALLHFCGSNPKKKDTRQRHTVNEQDLHEHLLPTAPPLSNAYSVSQLSINMLPPYFSALDNVLTSSQSFPSAPPNSDSVSQIVQIKGQSFILLPLSENVIPTDSDSIARWNNQSNAPKDQSNGQQLPKAENSSSTPPATEECGCQTEAFSLHQVTQTSENGIQTMVAPCRESCQVQTSPITEDNPIESSTTNAVMQTEDLCMEATDPVSNTLDATMDCNALPNEACNTEILSVITQDEDSCNSTTETQMETMESGESTDSLSTNPQESSSQERFSVSTDEGDTAINMNTFSHNIPSLDNLAQSTSHPSSTDISSDSVSSNNSLSENYSIPMDHTNDNRVNTDGVTVDINENYPEQSTTVIDIVNNNDACDNVGDSYSTQNSEYSVIRDPNHDISTVDHSTCSAPALLGTNENYIEQYSENVSDIDDADICDRSSPPPSYEEVTQGNLVIAGHGLSYHGTL